MKLLRDKQVAEKLSCAQSYVWRLVHKEGFPKPLRIGKRHVAWLEEDIDAWLLTLKQGEKHET